MPPSTTNNKDIVDQLVLVVVSEAQAGQVGKNFVADGFRFTVITAANGLLATGTSCLLLGINSSRSTRLMRLIESVCKTRHTYIPAHGQISISEAMPPMMIEAEVGSASVYILSVESYEAF